MTEVITEETAARLGLRLLVQFGSTVTGAVHARSDIDVAALFDHEPSLEEFGELHERLQPLAKGRPLDLAVLNHADPLFLKQVSESAQLLYGSPTRFHEFRTYAYRRYQDHRRFLDLERRHVARAAQRLASRG